MVWNLWVSSYTHISIVYSVWSSLSMAKFLDVSLHQKKKHIILYVANERWVMCLLYCMYVFDCPGTMAVLNRDLSQKYNDWRKVK